jgi:outer membrane biosynthesis protein TonB
MMEGEGFALGARAAGAAFPLDRSLFSALSDEPIFHASEHRREDARRRWLSVALVASVYGLIAAAVLFEHLAPLPPVTREIPVEIVVAPPQEQKPPPKPEPEPKLAEKPKPPDKDERPAYDAPKAGTAREDDVDRKSDTKPPPAQEASVQSAEKAAGAEGQEQAPQLAALPQPAPQTPEPAQPPLKTADDGELPQASAAPPSEAPAAPSKPLFAAGKGKLFAALPSVEFGGAPMKAPVENGEGPAGYLNIVVGLIRARLHKPHLTRTVEGAAFGLIVFRLGDDGRILDSWFVQHSGSPEYDRAEMDALTGAAPFPKPPYIGRSIEYRYRVE